MLDAIKKITKILNSGQKKNAYVLFVLMVVGMIFEVLGVGLVFPLLQILSEENISEAYPIAGAFIEEISSDKGIIVLVVILLFSLVYFIKFLFMLFLNWKQQTYVWGIRAGLSKKLYTIYLGQSYDYHLNFNSAKLIRNITNDSALLVAAISSILALTAELMVVAGLLMLLLFVETVGAILIFISLSVIGWGIYYFTRLRLARWGKDRQFNDGKRIQFLQQGLGGIKEIKVIGCEQELIEQYDYYNKGSANAGRKHGVLQEVPRLALEVTAIFGLSILVIIMSIQDMSSESMLPVLGVFAASAFRIMPSVGRIVKNLQGLGYVKAVIDTVYHDTVHLSIKPQTNGKIDFNNSIGVANVWFKFKGDGKYVLRDISFRINKGTTVGIVGSSGSGKSTLVDILLGVLKPTNGLIEVDGSDIQSSMRAWQNNLGYVPQSVFLIDDSLRKNVAFGISEDNIDDEMVWNALCAAQLDDVVKKLPQQLDTIVGEHGVRLSGGQRQRIGIARALYNDPDVLFLDEATSSLDYSTEAEVMEAIELLHHKKTIIIVAHRLSTVEKCDWILRLDAGELVDQEVPSAVLPQMSV